MRFAGVLTIEQIEGWLELAKSISPLYVGLIIFGLLCIDLFIAVPTLTLIILAGYFLGFAFGALFSVAGIMSAGVIGYTLSRRYGDKILNFLIKDKVQREEAVEIFNRHGFVIILLSRAMPVMPEASACLSGITGMSFKKFFIAWMISTVPYVLIASYAGSISSIKDPMPAIIAAIGLSLFFSIFWFFYRKRHKKAN